MKQKLEDNEIEELKNFISSYHNLNTDLDALTEKIDEIEKIKTKLLEEIKVLTESVNSIREKEKEFNTKMIQKYGEFHLDLETFEISR